MIDHLERKKT